MNEKDIYLYNNQKNIKQSIARIPISELAHLLRVLFTYSTCLPSPPKSSQLIIKLKIFHVHRHSNLWLNYKTK